MNVGSILLGILVGVSLLAGVLVYTGSVSYDSACNDQLAGDEWTGEKVDTSADNTEISIECTRDNERKTITVSAVEVSDS